MFIFKNHYTSDRIKSSGCMYEIAEIGVLTINDFNPQMISYNYVIIQS